MLNKSSLEKYSYSVFSGASNRRRSAIESQDAYGSGLVVGHDVGKTSNSVVRLKGLDATPSRLDLYLDAVQNLSLANQAVFKQFGFAETVKTPFDNIHNAFLHFAAKQPYAIAVEDAGREISYGQLEEASERLARQLILHDVFIGTCVPLFLERSLEMVVGIMAILRCGAAYAPQHFGVAKNSQLQHVVNTTDAKVIVTLRKFYHEVSELSDCTVLCIEDYIDPDFSPRAEPLRSLPDSVDTDSSCLVLFTSGTTGNPNGVQVSHRNLCNILTIAPGNLGIKPGTLVSQILSISFDMAAWEIHGCLGNGGTLLIRGKDIEATASRANVVIATPSILSRFEIDNFDHIKTVAVAGEPCPHPLADLWSDRCDFYNSCGPTETTIVNTMSLHDSSTDQLCIGGPTPNNTVYILDEDRVPCVIGEVGEMWAGGDCVTLGYLNNPELTAERYAVDPFLGGDNQMFNTRDLGRWCQNGELEHLGRTDDQVKIRGFRVELDSVSAVMERQADCSRAVTLKYDDRTLVGFMMPATADTQAARKAIEEKLPYYCTPTSITALDALPMTSRGKIDKRALLDSLDSSGAGASEVSVERTKSPVSQAKNVDLLRDTDVTQLPIESYSSVELPEPNKTIAAKLTHPRFYHYWRLVTATLLVNLLMLIYAIGSGHWWSAEGINLAAISNMVVANILVTVVFRQQYVINLLFKLATSVPVSAPLGLRQLMGKVYHFGGLHIGGAIAGTFWMILLVASVAAQYAADLPGLALSGAAVMSAVQIALLLVLMIVMAAPTLRQKFHNQFEIVHRFAGWTVLVLFWIHFLFFVRDVNAHTGAQSYGSALVSTPAFWGLLLVTFSIVLPWLRLKRVPVEIHRPSDHVILARFDYGVTPFAGSSTAISRSPLTEWHSFANVPEPGRDGFRLTISRAGDWTGKLIDDLPSHVWVKGIPTAGVGNVDQLFKKVVWVATGSGIGPTLPHLLAQEVPAHLVWSTRNARKTYGDDLVDEILEVEPNALIWDTDERGRPDLVKLAYAAVQAFDAEAVIVIANEKLTRMVVHGMECRSIPAYGAIWDS